LKSRRYKTVKLKKSILTTRALVCRGCCAVFCIQPCECWRSFWPVGI